MDAPLPEHYLLSENNRTDSVLSLLVSRARKVQALLPFVLVPVDAVFRRQRERGAHNFVQTERSQAPYLCQFWEIPGDERSVHAPNTASPMFSKVHCHVF